VVWFGRTAVPSRCVSWLLSLLHCPGHTQQEIADAVGVNPTDKCLRLSGNLDTCPKNQKLAALFEEAILYGFRQVSETV